MAVQQVLSCFDWVLMGDCSRVCHQETLPQAENLSFVLVLVFYRYVLPATDTGFWVVAFCV